MPLKNLFQVYMEDLLAKSPFQHELKLMSMNYPNNSDNYKEAKWTIASTKLPSGGEKMTGWGKGGQKISNFSDEIFGDRKKME